MYQIATEFPIEGYVESRIGGRPENQDNSGFEYTPLGLLVVVCDGMGGMQGGSTASALAVQTILNDVAIGGPDPEDVLRDAVLHANDVILSAGNSNPELTGMGTTVTAVLINENRAYAVHVGDSRIYIIRKGKKVFRTFDDSAVFQYVRNGMMTEEEARVSGKSNIILKALGIRSELDFDVESLSFDKGDRFVLCTDGFWGNVPEKEFLDAVSQDGSLDLVLERAADRMEKAGRLEKDGNHDNLTAAVFDVSINSKFRSLMEKVYKRICIVIACLLLISIAFNLFQYFRSLKSDLPPQPELEAAAQDSVRTEIVESEVTAPAQEVKNDSPESKPVVAPKPKKQAPKEKKDSSPEVKSDEEIAPAPKPEQDSVQKTVLKNTPKLKTNNTH